MALTLYYFPGACSLAPHIALREAQMDFELLKVDLANHTVESGEDYYRINPKGYVPALRLDDGEILTEAGVILQYLADQSPEHVLAPPQGTMQRYRMMENLNFIATEIHKAFAPLFNPGINDDWKRSQIESLARRFDYLNDELRDDVFVCGYRFTVADAYLYTVLRWAKAFGIGLARWPAMEHYRAKIQSRPSVQEALRVEGFTDEVPATAAVAAAG